ncbi:uncharacterized protein CC84DRAFT_1168003 [Paraphaeosphaeria sporulosa]|uniref:Uncharacterized protein n=1 Tax=Paraphaeosphaeria sporulosa TaxID=1460663 RepID=A0A177C031_9PLEO|nr:uncharacterized protein CC84DRAFT_1168003 [Paraphaeosphaeria sporulosa]OAG00766.1 hypothetical protein CC84DRAFT_1168003 [Paraphaeosphaeria sporulosa]
MVRCENPIHGTGSSSACGLIVSHSVPPGRTLRSNSAPRPHRPGRMHAPLSTPRLPLHEPLLSHLHFQREPSKLTAVITIHAVIRLRDNTHTLSLPFSRSKGQSQYHVDFISNPCQHENFNPAVHTISSH